MTGQTPSRRISMSLAFGIRYCVLVFLFGGLLTPAQAQSGPIALVQHTSKDAGTVTSSSLGFASNNIAGHWIGVVVRAGALNEAVTVSDSNHNVYQKAFQFNQTTDGFTFAIFYAESIAGGANTVTVSQSISGTLRFAILEYSGVAAAGSLDVIATAQGHSTAPSSAPSVNTTANGDLLLGAVMTGNPQNATAGSGYTIEESVPAIPSSKLIVEDQIQSVAGASVVNATISSADDWAAGFAAFKVSNGSGGSPNISGLNPTSGAVSTPVVISGTNFGSPQGTSTVKFNGTLATPTAWSATSITAPVPSGATTGSVVVNVGGTNSNGVNFTVNTPPSVTINQAASQADPTSASPINFTAVFSTTVTGFATGDVTLGGTAGATTAVVTGSGTTYNVAVSGMTQSGTVTASIPAGVASGNGTTNTASTSTDNTVTFNFSAPPTITTVNPNTGPVGTSVTITGTNFGTSQGTSTVTFNGVSSTPTNWSATSITAPVPTGLAAGAATVVVTVNGTASNGMTFTVTGSGAGIALVQHTSKDAGTGASSALAFNSNNTVGNFIAVAVRAGALNEVVTVADSNHNTYQRAIQLNQTTDGFTFAIYYAENVGGGANTVTVSQSISGTLRFAILEYSGVATAGSLDAIASAQGHSTAPSSGSVSTTASGDLLLGSVMTGNPEAFTAGSGYQIEENTPAEPSTKLMVEDQVRGATGPASASATLGVADDWATGMAAFKAGGGVVAPPPTITGLNPGSGGVGSSVVITGTNFGSPQGASTVKFNGVTATATAWTATSITATVPTGATTGNVVVTVGGVASNGVSFSVTPQPSVTINQAAAQADPTKNTPINFTAVFSAAVTGFTNTGVTLGGTAGATTAVVTGSGTTYNVAVSGMTQSGSVTATIPAGVATANGATNTASTSTDNTVTYDITPPSVTINQAASQADPTAASPINFAAVFSEAVTGFSNAGVTLGGTAGATTALVTGSGTTYNVAVSGMTQTGTVTATIGAGKANDLAGNPNTASTSTDNSVTYNASAPTVTINQAAAQADPTNGSTINFTAVFSVAVTGFTNADVTLGGTAGATTVAVTGGPSTYNVAVTGMTQSGTVTASIPAGVATGNGTTNTASTSTDNTVTYDITPPTVTINQAASQADPTGGSPINFTAVFSEAVTGFTNTGVTLGGTAGATTVVLTGSGTTYNVAVSGMTLSGTVTASIGAGKANDLAGNPNTASTSTDNSVTYNAQSGLVAAYSFEEGSGTTTADSSGNNNTGTLTTGVTWTTGIIGGAVAFNGSSGNVAANDSPSLDLTGSFTLSGWVKPATVSGTGTVIIKETTSGCGYFMQIVDGQIDSGFNNGSGCVEHISTTANLVAGNWYYIAVVLDHSNNVYNTYLNGNLIASTAETGVPVPNNQSLTFGQSGDAAGGFERYNGVLDEVKIYNRALSATEVLQLFNAASGAPTITGLNPTSGVVGEAVTITGSNFGSPQGSSTVKFNGVLATPTAWGASSITAPVPAGATTGNVVVMVGGVPSNGVSFAVTSNSLNVTISPKRAGVTLSQPQQFTGTVNNDPLNGGITWSVDGVNSGNATSGTVSASGLYTPGTQPGVHTVKATSNSNTAVSASSTVAVTDLAGVFTYHNDTARTGQNLQEYALTTSTVNSSTFGALFTCQVDGYLYAAPLYYANLNVGGVTRNVVFIATEHDSVYAFDADSPACVQLWKTSFISPPNSPQNVVPVAPSDVDELSDLTPEIGITSTPVIDPNPTSNTIYVMAKTKEFVGTVSGVACTSSAPCFVHRLHALSVTDGTEKFGGPVVVTAPNFVSLTHLQRPGLLLNNGTVYVAIGSHGDNGIWQGWMMAYNATTLAQQWFYHSSDPINGNNGGAIWGSGNAPAVDASGNIYFETGNGNYDGVNNWADSVIKLTPAGGKADSFTPFDQQIMQNNDIDLGSSNPIILPDSVGSSAHPHLMIAMGKVGVIYLLDQTAMGGYNTAANQDVGEVTIMFNTSSSVLGFYGQPAYWNGNLYEIVVNDSLRQLPIANGSIATSSTSHSSNTFTFRGATPVVSATGTSNGIVWTLDDVGYQTSTPVVLYAYDATNLGTMLFSSPGSGAGSAPISVKFAVPTVANGKVYVGGQKAFTVFGLLPN